MISKPHRAKQESAPPSGELSAHVGNLLRLLADRAGDDLRQAIEKAGVSVAEWIALRTLHTHGEAGSAELVAALGMTKGAVSKLVARLAEKRLVHAVARKQDRRAQRLTLTAAGRKLVPRLLAIAEGSDRAFFSQLPRREQVALWRLLKELAASRDA